VTTFEGRDLTCVRGERLVLDGTSFRVAAGGALILTGPNGAGKSTLLRLMAGLMRPVAGALSWAGADVNEDQEAHRARIAYVGHADAVKPALSVIENVRFWAELSGTGGMSPGEALAAVGIGHLADLPARYLSAGQRRRVGLTRMLTSPATIWLLDEPTTSLDAAASEALGSLIETHRQRGGVVVVSTHTDLGLADADTLALGAA
jgi:heme exporter protein A